MENKQTNAWKGEFGQNYNARNPQTIADMDALYIGKYGVSRTSLNYEFLNEFPRHMTFLEVGCNKGTQMLFIREMGFVVQGVELQEDLIAFAHAKGLQVAVADVAKLPFADKSFDVVYTSGLLIHIHPDNLGQAMDEIIRVAKSYVWGVEYFCKEHMEIPYHGEKCLCWKGDFAKMYEARGLELVKQRKLNYLIDDNQDAMFLLRKAQENGNPMRKLGEIESGEL